MASLPEQAGLGARCCPARLSGTAGCRGLVVVLCIDDTGPAARHQPRAVLMLTITLPDGTEKQFDHPITPQQIAAQIGPRLAQAALAAQVDGQIVGLDQRLPPDGRIQLRLLTRKDPESLGVIRHSCAHVMARAVMRLFDGVQLAFGPTIDGGFYYDFDLPHTLTEEDFPAIEAEMSRIIELGEPFERLEEPRDKALQVCRDLNQAYKVEHIQEGLADDAKLSFYRQGEFLDLCRGPHVPCPGDRGLQAAVGRRCLLEGRCLSQAIAAALRHGLFPSKGAGSASGTHRGG